MDNKNFIKKQKNAVGLTGLKYLIFSTFDSLNLYPGNQFALAGWDDVAVITSGGADAAVAKVLLQGDYAVVVCYVFNVPGTGAAGCELFVQSVKHATGCALF